MAAEELEAQMGLGITFSVGVGQATIRTVWVDAGDVPDTVSKWQSYVDLVQILQEIGMCQVMFNPNTHGPNDECFMVGMSDLVLQHTPPAFFGSLILFWPICQVPY